MNKYIVEARQRNRSLLIVEGKHEKNQLFWLIFQCFPELDIDIEDVWIYGANIYKLYEDIEKEYGVEWDEEDIDLPFVISKKEQSPTLCYKKDFTNVILVFDYERHDPQFSISKIEKMQKCFNDSTDMGKLYLNYPMIESYLHVKALPDITYIERKIPITLQPGDRYKGLVKKESVIVKLIDFPHRINDLLAGERYQIMDLQKRRECCEKILNISNEAMQEKQLDEALFVIGDSKKEKTLKYQLKDWLKKTEYVSEKQNYWQYMRNMLQTIHTPIGDAFMCFITSLGNVGAIWIVLAVVLIAIPKTRKSGIIVAAALIIDAVLCSGILKNVFRRIRPFDVNTAVQVLITKPRDFSFPSGHTSASFAAATALYLAKERKLFAPTLVSACLIAFSRMYLYVHYPTDIIGGLLLGIASAYLAYWCQKKIPAVRRNSEKLAS